MNIIPLQSNEFESITGEPVYLSIFDKSGKKIYAAKADPSQLSLLGLEKGNIVSFSMGLTISGRVDYEVIECSKILVREAKSHQIHVQLIVDPKDGAQSEDLVIKRPERVFLGPNND
ncbi:hypothetical protein [Spirosoma linguale]|uniref:Uncharacterized protein n=1 Tax=Spirosoma linguale (strain ATCC 33905 / DSM 74 / LMG 10896 / Claus 1) TaxID=504472 RepID=D2QTJ5_SPILD|nr:hypothetical protein Slin_6167 [Spirosoma linguale DSM 74]